MKLIGPDGNRIESSESITYLGTTMAADGGVFSELNRRLGRAWAEYRKLSQLWKHSTLPVLRKLELLQSVIFSLVLYGMSTVWLNARKKRQLDGFQSRCLRDILKIPHPYTSRVSNQTVLEKSGQKPLKVQLIRQQLLLLGRDSRAPNEDARRLLTFAPSTLPAATSLSKRRVGWPRFEWARKLLEVARQTWGFTERVEELLEDKLKWESEVRRAF